MYEELAKKLLLRALQEIRDVGPVQNNAGICSNADAIIEDLTEDMYLEEQLEDIDAIDNVSLACENLRDETIEQWPKYNGNKAYPVQGGGEEYSDAQLEMRLWNRDTEYGALRWELLNWMIGTLEGRHE